MAPKRKSNEGAGSQGKKPAPSQRQQDDGEQLTQTQLASIISDDERDRIAADIGRYFIFHEHTKRGITRADLRQAILPDRPGRAGGKILDVALEQAKLKLQEAFGLTIELLPDAPAMEAKAAKGSREACETTDDGAGAATQPKTTTSGRLVLANALPSVEGAEPDLPKEERMYLALVVVTLGIIRHSDMKATEDTLFTELRSIGLDKDERSAPFPHLEELITKRMVKDMYLQYSKNNDSDGVRVLIEGPRAPTELSEGAWASLREVCKDTFALSQDATQPNALQSTQPPAQKKRRSRS